jgi:hypothetical protein
VHEQLQQLIRNFDDSPANSGRMMRELLEKDGAAFLPAALAALQQARESCGYRYLVALLARNDLLLKCVWTHPRALRRHGCWRASGCR